MKEKATLVPEILCDMIVMFAVLVGLGFPGQLADVTVPSFAKMCEYGVFVLEIAVMFFSSGEGKKEFRLLNIKPRYALIYIFLFFLNFCSMIATTAYKDQIISCVHVSVTILFGLWIGERYHVERILELYGNAFVILVMSNVLFAVLFDNKAYTNENHTKNLCGIYTTKNTCGAALSFGIMILFLLFIDYWEKKKVLKARYIITLLASIVLVLMCNATGSLFCAILPCIYVIIYKKSNWKIPVPGACYTLGSIGMLVTALTVIPVFKPFFDAIDKDITLTGRTLLWDRCLYVIIRKHTLTGFGYGQFWYNRWAISMVNAGFRRNSFFSTMQTGSHNVLIELWLNIGLLGLTAYIIMCLFLFNKCKYLSHTEYMLTICFAFLFMLHGFTERAFFTCDYHTLTLFTVLSLCANAEIPRAVLRNPSKYRQYQNPEYTEKTVSISEGVSLQGECR